ncbi:pterocarpan synthase 1-like [Silene latifolia]|uniref:pterocarpan synthase 1-like n=1 Tax=Silene latifolia TaxID=37657 RepID=UPI003D78649A
MANSITSSIILLSLITLTSLPSNQAYIRTISKESIGIKDGQQTQLTFYYHDTLSGSNPTSVQIAKVSGSNNSPSTFGSLSMIDDPLTETADSSSKLIGRAQGMYAMADQNEFATIMIMNILILDGDFNGSTLSVLGRNIVNAPGVQELPVIGGTGGFRFAKGYAQAKTQTYDKKTGDSVVEYNVFVTHSSSSTPGSDDSPSDDGGSPGSPSKNGSSSPRASSHASLSNFVSLSFLLIPLLYLCIV